MYFNNQQKECCLNLFFIRHNKSESNNGDNDRVNNIATPLTGTHCI